MTSHQMTPEQLRWFAIVFPVFFVGLWVAITGLIGVMSGWYQMARAYPDQPEAAVRRFSFQSASMGAQVSLQGVLRMDVCPSGLRFGILRIFGLFCRDFYVPWDEITVRVRRMFLVNWVELRFGGRDFPKLLIRASLAERIVAIAPGKLKLADGVPG
jgi:hypothetical protein